MSAQTELRLLVGEIRQGMLVLGKLTGRLADFVQTLPQNEPPQAEQAMVIAQYLTHYYTCAETMFLRISRHFENSLPGHAWHQTLLDNMALEVAAVRRRGHRIPAAEMYARPTTRLNPMKAKLKFCLPSAGRKNK